MEALSGWLIKEGGVRHNLKKRWFTCDSDGITYYDDDSTQSLRNPLGYIDSKDILTICDMGNLKKRDYCIEVITKERTW